MNTLEENYNAILDLPCVQLIVKENKKLRKENKKLHKDDKSLRNLIHSLPEFRNQNTNCCCNRTQNTNNNNSSVKYVDIKIEPDALSLDSTIISGNDIEIIETPYQLPNIVYDIEENSYDISNDQFVSCDECHDNIGEFNDSIHIVYKGIHLDPNDEKTLCTACLQHMEKYLKQNNYKCDEWKNENVFIPPSYNEDYVSVEEEEVVVEESGEEEEEDEGDGARFGDIINNNDEEEEEEEEEEEDEGDGARFGDIINNDDEEEVEIEVEEEEEVEVEVEEEDEEEAYEVTIKKKLYYTTNEIDGIIYSIDNDDEIGDEVGHFKNGKPVFNKKK